MTRERHAALEEFQRFIEWQIAPFESLDQGFEFTQSLLEIRGFAVAGQVLSQAPADGVGGLGAQRYTAPQARVNVRLTPRQGRNRVPGLRLDTV